ncbi:zinc finger protein 646 [Pelobates fuscus]|uniref:zinc finger protein 646 n=1 Tax=Pelobates fuscus TaxID=191477 RepID=UPI002FE4A317
MDECLFSPDQLDGATDNALSCNQCPSSFASLSELESHLENHKEERPFKCNQCDRSYRHAGSLVNHKKTHQVGLYSCLICQKEYSNPMGLKNHLRTHSEDKRFKCEECGECFRMSRQLSNHRKATHGYYAGTNDGDIPGSQEGFEMPPPVLVENSNLMSNLENYIAESMVPNDFSQLVPKYYAEEKTQEVAEESQEVKQESAAEDKEGQMVDGSLDQRRYKCKQCGKAYKHAGSLANHRQSHTVGVYQCAICYKEFSNLMAMKNHCRLHTNSRAQKNCRSPYFSTKLSSLSDDNPDKPHQTALLFSDPMEKHEDQHCFLEASESSHSEEETRMTSPHKSQSDCLSPSAQTVKDEADTALRLDSLFQTCKAANVVQDEASPQVQETPLSLDVEQRLTAPPGLEATDDEELKPGESSEERPFMCQECGRTYRHAGSLINHKKTHQTGIYSCSICAKQLFNMAALKNHLRAHFKSRAGRKLEDTYFHSASFSDELFQSTEDSYQCGICHKVLTCEMDYLQHQALHKDEKVMEIGCDNLAAKEEPSPDICWGENPQGSQGSSDDSAYSSVPGIPEAIKREVENLALQPSLQPWAQEESLEITKVDKKREDPGTSFQNPIMSIDQSPANKIVPEQADLPELEEHSQYLDDRPFKCEACGRTYRHKSSLLNHKLTHKTGIYQCSLCPKQYSNLMALRNHLRFHSRIHAGRRNISKRSRQLLCGKPKLLPYRTGMFRGALQKLNLNHVSSEMPLMANVDPVIEGSETEDTLTQVCEKKTLSSTEEMACTVKNEPCALTESESGTSSNKESQGTGSELVEHTGKKVYECDLCDKTYRHSGSLINHKRTHQTGDYTCSVCSKHVRNLAALKNHLRIHHKVRREKSDGNDNSGYLYSNMYFSQDNKRIFGCPSCEEIFPSEEHLLAHQDTHMEVGVPPWGHLADVSGLDDPQPEIPQQPGMGDYDDWESSSQSEDCHKNQNDLENSFNCSEEDKTLTYPCEECGEVCSSIEDLNTHKHTHQIGIYQCSFCPKEYPNLLALRNHFQTHTKSQILRTNSREILNGSDNKDFVETHSSIDHRYDCGHCGMIFSDEADFHQHQVAHENQAMSESPHGLPTTENAPGYPFTMHSSERELLRRIKNEMEEGDSREVAYGTSQLSHICGFCGKTYDDLESLEAHGLTHSNEDISSAEESVLNPEVAEFPSPEIQQSQEIKEEEGDHIIASEDPPTGGASPEDRPYTCDQCGKTYRHGGSLVNHKKTHLVGNFQCLACLRHYPNLAAFRNHLRHHPKCKQHAAIGNPSDLDNLNPNDPLNLNPTDPKCLGENPENCHPAVDDSQSNLSESRAVYDASEPSMPCTSNDNSSNNYNPSQLHTQSLTNNFKLPSKRLAGGKSLWKAMKKRRMLINHCTDDLARSISTSSPRPALDTDDKSVQVCELCGKLCIGVDELVMHLSGNCDGNRHLETAIISSGSTTDIKADTPIPLSISNSTGEYSFHQRPFRCDVCGRSYRHAGSLINHKQSHKTGVFRCAICQKRFFNLMAMKNHNRIHFELKRHKCLECGKAFRLHKQLDTHQRIHRDRAAEKKPGRRKRRGTKSRKLNALLQQQKSSFLKNRTISPDKKETFSPCEGARELNELSSAPEQSVLKKDLNQEARPYQCEQCGRSYRHAGSLVNHKKSHTIGQYSCTVCDKTYSNLMAMKNHQRTHYEAKRHHCSECGRSFRWKRQLSRHQLAHAQEISQLSSKVIEGSPPLSETVPDQPSKLEFSKTSLSHRESRKRLQNCSSGISENENTAIPSNLSPSSPLKPVCQDCGILFVSYDELENHMCSESNAVNASYGSSLDFHQNCDTSTLHSTNQIADRPYQCNLCGRTYRHAGSLLNHKNTHKTGVYKCSICLKQFFNPMAIKNHLRTHTAEKRFQCLECGKAFRSSRELICHHRVHTGERPFHCPICNRGFSSKLTLRHHQRTHKELPSFSTLPQSSSLVLPTDVGTLNTEDDPPVSGEEIPNHTTPIVQEERKYKCNQCDRSYRHAGSLLNHRKTHSTGVYQCPDCHKKFYNLLALKNHLRIHRYPCPDCGKAFRIASHLATHRKVHEQGGPFTCQLCSKRFFCRSTFEQHQLTHGDQEADVHETQAVGNFMVEVT